MKAIIGITFALFVLSATAQAASFDCKRATTTIEKLICENEELSKLDEELSKTYLKSLENSDLRQQTMNSQRQWLKNRRNVCQNSECVRDAYEARIKELGLMITVHTNSIHCSKPGVDFEIRGQRITSFYAQSAISDPDLANGYSTTCVQHIDKFSQSKKDKELILSFNESNDQYGESVSCKVHVADLGKKFHLYTTDCVSECMKFNYQLKKVGNDCRAVK
jgi:uncharacterized protein